jgi:hypothetical protein
VAEAESDDRIDVFIGDLGGFPVSGGGAGGASGDKVTAQAVDVELCAHL